MRWFALLVVALVGCGRAERRERPSEVKARERAEAAAEARKAPRSLEFARAYPENDARWNLEFDGKYVATSGEVVEIRGGDPAHVELFDPEIGRGAQLTCFMPRIQAATLKVGKRITVVGRMDMRTATVRMLDCSL